MAGFPIEDGKGRGYSLGINKNNKALTLAEVNLSAHYASVNDGLAFNINSTISSAAAGNYILYVKNTDKERDMFVDLMRVASANAVQWKVWGVTGDSTGGSTISPVNLNRGSGQSADAHVRGNGVVTGLTTDGLIANVRTVAGGSEEIPFDDVLLLGTDDAIAVEYDGGSSGAAEVLMRTYFLRSSDET